MKHHESPESWFEANEALDRRMVASIARKDVAGLLSCFLDSPELVAVLCGTEMHGLGELRQAVASLFSHCDSLKLSIDRITRIRTGDVIIAVGRATYTRTMQGKDDTHSQIWTDVRRLVNGRWVYVLSHREVLPGT